MLSTSEREQFTEQGYVIVEAAVEPGLMTPLREAAARIADRTRRGDWPHFRAVGDGDVWGVQHLLHPDLGEPVFADYMASNPVLEVACDLLQGDLRLGLVNMLCNPAHRDFAIGWHRDMLPEELAPEEEVKRLAGYEGGVQWNTALYDDSCLLIVPASHRRAATAEEREVQFRRPMDSLTHQMVVNLKAGQGVYYNSQLIHRGIYPSSQPRATLHAALTRADAMQFANHYTTVQWMEAPGFRESLPARLLPLYDRWREFGKELGV
ncbi:MAG TPA: phytanoyl-CoA dioxygenase family protein [Armatimonadota bacterium]|nr:phytanoyl-CoA dioxygenase family protein [Armatimonadota bacterium]